MATSFQRIYDKFLAQIDDTDLLKLDNKDIESFLFNYLENSMVDFKCCKKKLSKVLNVEKQQFDEDLDLEEIFILSLGMVLHWLQPQVQRLQLIRQSLGDRDFKLSSNWQTLDKISTLEDKTRRNLKNYIISYTYNDLKYR